MHEFSQRQSFAEKVHQYSNCPFIFFKFIHLLCLGLGAENVLGFHFLPPLPTTPRPLSLKNTFDFDFSCKVVSCVFWETANAQFVLAFHQQWKKCS